MKKFKIASLVLLIVVLLFGNSLFSQDYQFDLIPNKSPDEIRVLKILIAADQGYQEWVGISNWQEEITGFINQASEYLEVQAGIKLEIAAFENWQKKTSGRQDWLSLLAELRETFPRTEKANFDVVMGLTPDSNCHGASVYSGYILINCMYSYVPNGYDKGIYYWLSPFSRATIFPSTIMHELGHLFGCEHRLEKYYVMYLDYDGYSTTFCKENVEVIQKNKWRKFSKTSPL